MDLRQHRQRGVPPSAASSATTSEKIDVEFECELLGTMVFRLKRNEPLQKAMDEYCTRTCQEPHRKRFLFEGEPVVGRRDTPSSLGMEGGPAARIDVFHEQ